MRSYALFAGGLCAGFVAALGMLRQPPAGRREPAPAVTARSNSGDVAALKGDVERLKAVATDQSHVMTDVGHQFSCLWFAGRARNWPLADFFFSETQSHLRWAVRVIPVRKDAASREVDLRGILQGIETSSLQDLHDSIAAKDEPRF